ncbi:MAG: hypothetical protein MK324_02265 [Pirellulales bacterium]|jgi:hypothetical protein|nr:hypothetical protein [Pirellulales bacterium]|tara:strand:+ start:501 stop:734 length:234 start_codon:yes stop_codon:yes gene_type:complete
MIQKRKESYNLFEHMLEHGTGNEFQPESKPSPTNAPPGSDYKIDVLMKRLESGEDLWNDRDRDDFEGLIAPIKPSRP